jgi:hypothetical protein
VQSNSCRVANCEAEGKFGISKIGAFGFGGIDG